MPLTIDLLLLYQQTQIIFLVDLLVVQTMFLTVANDLRNLAKSSEKTYFAPISLHASMYAAATVTITTYY